MNYFIDIFEPIPVLKGILENVYLFELLEYGVINNFANQVLETT